MAETLRVRREPPRYRRVAVKGTRRLTPRLVRVTLAGAELEGLVVTDPAASVRVLLPSPGAPELVIPAWNGNEFLLPDGTRPVIRTFTPRRVDERLCELDIDIVLHGEGLASGWASSAAPGDLAAISGPGRGYVIDPEAKGFVLAGDETAVPAIGQLLEHLPATSAVRVHIEVARPEARLELPPHPGVRIEWMVLTERDTPGAALVRAVAACALEPEERLWAAGEAAAMQLIRRDLFSDRAVPRSQATVRGYWKAGRSGGRA